MRLVILYGSQTGTAQDVAEQIWRESKCYSFNGPVMSMNDYKIQNLINETLVVFVVATTGQGDEPDNMKAFWKFLLRKNLPTNSLDNLKFACLGLGDSSYAKYNYAAKRLNKRLIQLSACSLLTIGLCDDQHDHGIAATYLPWMQNLWLKLSDLFPYISRKELTISPSKWDVIDIDKAEKPTVDFNKLLWPLSDSSFLIKVKENVRTTSPDHFQDVRLITFEKIECLKWTPGDVLNVRPWNTDENVDKLFNLLSEQNLELRRDTVVDFKQTNDEMPLPIHYQQPVTLEMAAKYIWDLNALPRPRVFELLALNCNDELIKEKFIEFTTPEGLDDVIKYVNRPRRTILEVLSDFPTAVAGLTISLLFEIFQVIQPRSFSIASASESGNLQILVAVVEYKTMLSELRRGLCSNWLKNLNRNDEILACIKPGTMMIPRDLAVPIIMVGPGTGIAPFRSILMQRDLTVDKNKGKLVVFFGCRNQQKDFHFKSDLLRYNDNQLANCYFAFSRDQDSKVYVQHLIEKHSKILKDLIILENAIILVSGSSKNMPNAVKDAFIKIIGDSQYVEKLIKTNRYQEETWS